MTEVIAGQSVALLGQFYDFQGGTLTDLDATPTISIVSIATGATALAATTSGVTHPGTGSYGYAWPPSSSLTPGAYLATWSGLKAGAPVTAAETITVIAPASSEDANTSPHGVWYATREDVQRALDVKLTARNARQIDRALESASRDIEDALCHRRFYPVQATRSFDWPGSQNRPSWRLWLDDQELISLTSISSGGTAISPADLVLYPQAGPPYNRVETNLGSNAAWGGGSTHQRDIQITGLFGYRNTETTVGALTAAVTTTTATTVSVNGPAAAELGVGSVLRVDSERMLVTNRSMADTGQNLGGAGLTAQQNSVTVTVTDGTAFSIDETLLIESERMLIVDIAGNSLTVKRAWDGSVLAAHAAGVDIYAPRTLTVTRGALGTTAATHSSSSTVTRWDPPGPVRDLAIAESVNRIANEQAGYARTRKTGDGGGGERAVDATALAALRKQVYASHGRKGRVRAV